MKHLNNLIKNTKTLNSKVKMAGIAALVTASLFAHEYGRRKCPECDISWAIKRTENRNKGGLSFLADERNLYTCKECGYENWEKIGHYDDFHF